MTNKSYIHGNKMQELFVDYMESIGYGFLAGDRNGRTQNVDYIEEVTRSQYLKPINKVSGPMLRFRCHDGVYRNFVMPDELLISQNSGKTQFFDVKNRRIDNLYDKYSTLSDYRNVSKYSGIPVFLAVMVWNPDLEQYDIYCRNIKNILDGYTDENTRQNENIFLDLSKFMKI